MLCPCFSIHSSAGPLYLVLTSLFIRCTVRKYLHLYGLDDSHIILITARERHIKHNKVRTIVLLVPCFDMFAQTTNPAHPLSLSPFHSFCCILQNQIFRLLQNVSSFSTHKHAACIPLPYWAYFSNQLILRRRYVDLIFYALRMVSYSSYSCISPPMIFCLDMYNEMWYAYKVRRLWRSDQWSIVAPFFFVAW